MSIDTITICEWFEGKKKDKVIETPLWFDIESAINSLNNRNLHDIYLEPSNREPKTYLCIAGGDGRYLVSGSVRDQMFQTVIDSAKSDDGTENLLVAGEVGDYPSHWIVGINTAMQAARVFFETGEFDSSLEWVNV